MYCRRLHFIQHVLIPTYVHALSQEENPKGEDVECLCKLLSTIGAPLDANPKSKDRMTAYFSRLARLAEHPKLESRHKFMVKVRRVALLINEAASTLTWESLLTLLHYGQNRVRVKKRAYQKVWLVTWSCGGQDIIDLRAHNWVARRKVEGPKKIEDIHKDARMELQRQRMAPMPDRGDRRRGGPHMDRAPLPQCAP